MWHVGREVDTFDHICEVTRVRKKNHTYLGIKDKVYQRIAIIILLSNSILSAVRPF